MIDTGKSLHWWFAERSEVMKEKGKETSFKTRNQEPKRKWVDIEKKEGKTNDNVTCNNQHKLPILFY